MRLRVLPCAVLALCAASAWAQAPSRVLVDQVGKSKAGTTQVAQSPTSSIDGAQAVVAAERPEARPGAGTSRQDGVSPLAEQCARAAAGGGPVPAECSVALRQQAEAAAQRPTPEGTLLYLFGQQDSPTRTGAVASQTGADADAVARELGSESAGTGVNGDAAAIAARQRPGLQAGPPR